jgi:hypothetical protein
MALADIEEQVKPLSKAEKEQLIRDVQRMLIDEEIEQHGDEMLHEMIDPNAVYEIATPNITTDDDNVEAVRTLRNLLKEHGHAV